MSKFRHISSGSKALIYSVILSLIFLVFLPQELLSQEEFSPSRVRAERLFEDGDYQQALKHFDGLLKLYPSDPLYKYYAGACLVNSGDKSGRACLLLEEATVAGNSLRPIPVDGWYFLGRAYQLCGEYDKAIGSYDRFRDSVRKKDLKAYNIDELISQCAEGKLPDELVLQEEPESMPDIIVIEEEEVNPPDQLIEETLDSVPVPDLQLEETLDVLVVSDEYDFLATQALEFQFKTDSLSRLADRYRLTVKSLSGQDRETVSKKILELEALTFEYQALASKNLALAAAHNAKAFDGYVEEKDESDTEEISSVSDEAMEDKEYNEKPDTVIIEKEIIEIEPEPEAVLILFNAESKQADKIPVNDTLPEGLFYRIQTAAFRNPIKSSHFKTLGPVYGLKADDSDITFYSIGYFRKKEDADLAVVKVRAAGFKDAFVIAQFEGKRISFERAMVLENEWGNVSLVDPSVYKKPDKPAEPVTLVFRVQVNQTEEELPDDDVETYRLVAGNRDFEVLVNDNEEYVYLIGKFLTFESAASYSDLLFRNGIKEAKVVAYMGVKEIPVEKAKELFNMNYEK